MTDLLATPQHVASLRGVPYDPTDLAAVIALEAASDFIRAYCGQDFKLLEDDEITLDGNDRATLLLPQLPVIAVSEVAIDADVVDATDYRLMDHGILQRIDSGCWPRGYGNITVTYDHGYVLPGTDLEVGQVPLPADLQAACAAIAARAGEAGAGATTSETIGSYSVTYGDAETAGLTASELATLQLYRVREAAA